MLIIAGIIIYIAWVNDLSNIHKGILKKMDCKNRLEELEKRKATDSRIELYKTISYVLIALFWGTSRHIQMIIPCIILLNMLAYIRYLAHTDILKAAAEEEKTFPTLARMFLASGVSLGLETVFKTVKHGMLGGYLIGGFILLLFLPYVVRGDLCTKKILNHIAMLAPILFFVVGSIYGVNSYYGMRFVQEKETVIESIHSGMRTSSFQIPKQDAVDGVTSFSQSTSGNGIGDKVLIKEYEGCLGIRWFDVEFE